MTAQMSDCAKFPEVSELEGLIERDKEHDCSGYGVHKICVRVEAVASLPSRYGDFKIVGFSNNRDGKDHLAMVHGDIMGHARVPTRLHSECLTGDVMGSLRCDCRDQLESALERLASQERGLLLYMRQEGRGIGLINKLRAYALQERGLDTVEANVALGFRDDEREYSIAAHMLASLNVQSIELMTNNPDKIRQLEQLGILVSGRIPHVMTPNKHNKHYLETKVARSGHLMSIADATSEAEQGEPVMISEATP